MQGSVESNRLQRVIDGQSCVLEILHTAGQEEYDALREQCIRDGDGFVLVYSITNRSSFTCITRYYDQIQRVKKASASSPSLPGSSFTPRYYDPTKKHPIMLIGDDSDLVSERKVTTNEGYAMARELDCDFAEVSTNDWINVEKVFYDVVRKLRREWVMTVSRELRNGHYSPKQYGRLGFRYRFHKRQSS